MLTTLMHKLEESSKLHTIAKRKAKTIGIETQSYQRACDACNTIAHNLGINADDVTHQQIYEYLTDYEQLWFFHTYSQHIKKHRK